MSAVANAGPIIHRSWIGRLDLLPTLFDRIVVPRAVREGLPMTGPIGILRSARNRRNVPAVMPLLEELRRSGFRVSVELVERFRHEETALGQEE